MRITFIMPRYSEKPIGGYAVFYEYASHLAARGHDVTVLHPRQPRRVHHFPLARALRRMTEGVGRRSSTTPVAEVSWYPMDGRVKMSHVPSSAPSYVPDGDVLFTSSWVPEDYPREKGVEIRLLQGYIPQDCEMWPGQNAQQYALWRALVPKIVIARWLYDKGLELGVPANEMIHIPNGIDHARYRLLRPIEKRPPRISMLYHPLPLKGAEDGINALEIARRQFPILQAVLFGLVPRPEGLPDWIAYQCDPPQEQLVDSVYNGSSIYLCPSWVEGWHLPPAEAMACGCAVVSTDIGGVRDYAEHDVTALLSPAKDPEGLADNLLRLLEDDELRIRLAKAGHERIQEFTWERSTDLLEQFITDKIGGSDAKVKA